MFQQSNKQENLITKNQNTKMPFTYIIECRNKSFYIGSTRNLEKRIWEHEQGLGAKFTAKKLPMKLVYCEEYERIDDAFYREKQIQGWSRKKKMALIDRDFEKVARFSKSYTSASKPNTSAP
jgi:putative endonuclease